MSRPQHAREITVTFETLVQMLRDRRLYSEDQLAELVTFQQTELAALAASARDIFHMDFPACRLRLIYDLYDRFKASDVRKLLDGDGAEVPLDLAILVTKETPSTLALRNMKDAQLRLQIFGMRELLFNVSRHDLVPRQEPIRGKAEVAALMKRLMVKTRGQLLQILHTDAQARYLALQPGEVVKVTRHSPSAGECVSYRMCVRAPQS